jgi:hypothetical protein
VREARFLPPFLTALFIDILPHNCRVVPVEYWRGVVPMLQIGDEIEREY